MTDEHQNAPQDTDAPIDVAALKEEMAQLKDRALRALADAENTRKRAEREKADAQIYGISRFARDLLSVADNLSRALAAMPKEGNDSLRAVIEGVEATNRELQSVLAKHGVKEIQAQGAKFDPNLHQAIAEVPADGAAPGSVVSVVQSGYIIGDRLLRPAMVTVAKAGGGNGASAGGQFDTKV